MKRSTRLFKFEVRVEPVPKGSMRAFTRRGGGVGMTPGNEQKLRAYATAIIHQAKASKPIQTTGALELVLTFNLHRPKSRPKRDHFPDRKPDIDKLVRAVMDALTGVCYKDDAQVVKVTAEKRWHPDGHVSVEIEGRQVEEPVSETAQEAEAS